MIRFVLSLCLLLCASATPCPGGTSECPKGATCCELPDQEYGCCPLEDAVCCKDHIHCCPNGYVCNDGMCSKLNYNATLKPISKKQDIVCPDSHYSCPSSSSCCRNDDGEVIGCCIEPDAVCCPGGEYCCPNGTSCDLQKGQCNDKVYQNKNYKMKNAQKPREGNDINMSISMRPRANSVNSVLARYTSVICPDGQSMCPDEFTCCELPQGIWGCCPFPNANCCPDHLHCCPSEMSCSETSTSCQQSGFNMTSFKTLIAFKMTDLN